MPSAKRWRIIGCRAAGDVVITSLSLHGDSGALDAGIVPQCSVAPLAGTLDALTDGDASTSVMFSASQLNAPGFALTWTFTSAVEVLTVAAAFSGGPWREATLQYESAGSWQTQGAFVPGGIQDPAYAKVSAQWLLDGSTADSGPLGVPLVQRTPEGIQYWGQGRAPYTLAARFSPGLSNANPSLVNLGAGVGAFGAGDFELGLWLNLEAIAGHPYGRILESKRFGALGGWNLVQVEQQQRITFHLSDGYRLVDQPLPAGWHYVEVRRKSGQLGLFVDGTLLQTAPSTHNFSAPDFAIGGNLAGGERMAGLVNEVTVFKGSSRPLATYTLPARTTPRWERDKTLQTTAVRAHTIDREFGGVGRIWGTIETEIAPGNKVPTKARISLLRQRDRLLARETWSDPATGEWEVQGLDTSQQFIALAQDPSGAYRPVAADQTTPEATP